jgi:3-oxoacyl-(acyl-carrier-protein) synthase
MEVYYWRIARFYHSRRMARRGVRPLLPESHQPDRTGLYLATADAGAAASVSFWADALQAGPGFVTPRDFPWTLAKSPASLLARRFNLQGPSYTLAGHANATFAAFQHATDDLSSYRVDHALVIRFDAFAAATMMGYWLMREPVPESQALPCTPSAHACQIKAEALPPR